MELFELTAHELSAKLKNKEVTSVEITKSVIDRIEKVENKIDSYITLTTDKALETAKAVDEKIAKGEITVEEAVDKLFEEEPEQGENVKTSENQPIQGQQNPTEPNQKDEKSAKQKELLQAAVKEMYTLKAGFTKRLADLEREGKRMYIADNGKNMTMENKLKIADYLMPQFVQAEKECDAKVETVLTTLSQGLKEIGADTSVVETIRKQYKEEKQLKKTQYIKEYL